MEATRVVRHRLYFGIDGERWQSALARVLQRVDHPNGTGGALTLAELADEFRLSATASRALAEGMVRDGLLARVSPHSFEFGITDRLRAYAEAPLVDPLSRTKADALLAHAVDLAHNFNRTAAENRYEIDAMAVYGAYMNASGPLSDLDVAIVLRRRPPAPRPLLGRAQQQVEGHDRIRRMLSRHSERFDVTFFKALADVPRPFRVLLRATD